MGFEQMVWVGGVPAGQGFIGRPGVTHFLNVACRPDHAFAINNRAHLLQGEAVRSIGCSSPAEVVLQPL